MKFASLLATAVCVFVISSFFGKAVAETQKGFVAINSKKQLWVEYSEAKKDLPTLIVLNGLTYSTRQWDQFIAPLEKAGFGNCSNTGACSLACPKEISFENIVRMNRDFAVASLKQRS